MVGNGRNAEPKVIAEGRVVQIDLRAEEAVEIRPLKEEADAPIVLCFKDPHTGFYIQVFDHRSSVRGAYDEDLRPFDEIFRVATPCLVGFRQKNGTTYIAINHIGTPDMRDGGEGEELVLTRAGRFDKKQYRVMGDGKAIHNPTGVCLVEPR